MKNLSQPLRKLATCAGLILVIAPCAFAIAQDDNEEETEAAHMSETSRSGLHKIVVLPTSSPGSGAVTGSYNRDTLGMIDGANAGREFGRIGTEVGGITVNYPVPLLTIPGMIFGGLSGGSKRSIQDFRDALTEDLAASASVPLTNDALASDVFWSIRNMRTLEPKVLALDKTVPADTDAVLYVSLSEVGINIDEDVAIITTVAEATLQRISDGVRLYEERIQYQDSDTLSNWTKNDKAAWHAYANYARHFIGREIAAQIFERVELNHELDPAPSDGIKLVKKNPWRGVTKLTAPNLAWDFTLSGGNSYGPWGEEIDISKVSFDVEVYDYNQLVYSAKGIKAQNHTLELELEPCKTYFWSVRPNYPQGSGVKFGDWMRSSSNGKIARGNVGRAASVAAAYIQDFAALEVKCGRR